MTDEVTKLEQWMRLNRYSDKAFAKALAPHMKKAVGPGAVYQWRHRLRTPRPDAMAAIRLITKDKVRPDSFIEAAES